jgi:hypothetical protein
VQELTAGWTKVVLTLVSRYAVVLILIMVLQSLGGRMIAWPGLIAGFVLGLVRGLLIRVAARRAGPALLATVDADAAQRVFHGTPLGKSIGQVTRYLFVASIIFVAGAMAAMYSRGLTADVWLQVRSVVPAWFMLSFTSWAVQLPLPNGGKVVEMRSAGVEGE